MDVGRMLAFLTLIASGACQTAPVNTGATTIPAPAPGTTVTLAATQVKRIDIIPDPTPQIPCNTSWGKITVLVTFTVTANEPGNLVRLRLVDDDGLSDDLIGETAVAVPAGIAAGTDFTATADFAARCSQCTVAGAEDTDEYLPTAKIEFASSGDNYGEGSVAGGGTPGAWPGQKLKCDEGGLFGNLL